ncbi:isochorismate synthase [Nodosilinea sp. LEGE 07088]|uniref:isochorismate synthase n=1 Tax=Nodosilinea sp. LEGE 07088 TaxID=2777968 RepID=UPI00241432ED
MNFLASLVNGIGYITEAALEVFSPNHDSYPSIGIQPFDGEAYRPLERSHRQNFVSRAPQH